MFKLISKSLVVLLLGWVGSASAAMLPPVTVNGLEWLQPKDFVGITWNTIATVCNSTTGDCGSGALGPVANMDSWTWASINDVNALFNFFLPGDPLGTGPSQADAPSNTFIPDFLAAGFLPTGTGAQLLGVSRDTCPSGCGGSSIAWASQFYQSETWDKISTNTIATKSFSYPNMGTWMYREAEPPPVETPTPATLPLLGLDLAFLCYIRRKRITS